MAYRPPFFLLIVLLYNTVTELYDPNQNEAVAEHINGIINNEIKINMNKKAPRVTTLGGLKLSLATTCNGYLGLVKLLVIDIM